MAGGGLMSEGLLAKLNELRETNAEIKQSLSEIRSALVNRDEHIAKLERDNAVLTRALELALVWWYNHSTYAIGEPFEEMDDVNYWTDKDRAEIEAEAEAD